MVAGYFGDEFVGADADAAREAFVLFDASFDACGQSSRPFPAPESCRVKIRFVDADLFEFVCVPAEGVHDAS